LFLERILSSKRHEIEVRTAEVPLSLVLQRAVEAASPRDFLAAVQQPGLGVIAEVKRASPSRGLLKPDLDAPALARRYDEGGCIAVSVLTDSPFFGARPDDLASVRSTVGVPVLRKDFVVSDYQIWESRAMGADAVLLIVAALPQQDLEHLLAIAGAAGLCPLVEVHTAAEVGIALECGATLLGINNRDLHSFRVDLETTHRLRDLVPPQIAVVSESGIAGPAEAALVRGWGVDAVLVGEALVTCQEPENLLRALSLGTVTP
jgi:indole-3-glycerol phosphate synthase